MPRAISCLRCLLLACVVLLGFSGTIVITGAGVLLYQLQEYGLLTPENVNGPSISLMGLGLLTCILSWCAWQFDYSNKAQIIAFAVLLSILAGLVAGIGIWALVRSERIDFLSEESIQKALYSLYDEKMKDIWAHMHVRLNCCGVHGTQQDFLRINKSFPVSCCQKQGAHDPCNYGGCMQPVLDRTRSLLRYIFFLAFGASLLQGLVVALSVCYAKALAEAIEKRRDEILRSAQAQAQAQAQAMAQNSIQSSRPPTLSDNGSNFGPLVEKPRMPPRMRNA